MRYDIHRQLALNTTLLPDHICAFILAGNPPPLADIIMPLLICSLDCEAVISSDRTASWNERRLARQLLAVSFLTALLFDGNTEPGNESATGAAATRNQDRK